MSDIKSEVASLAESEVSTRRRDRGMTLPELLVTVSMMGLIAAVLTASLVVIFRSERGSEGRLEVSRSEYNVGLVVPSDLASAAYVDTDPTLSPCEGGCPDNVLLDGSNALMMTWFLEESNGTDVEDIQVNVSYHFRRTPGTETYELVRIECTAVLDPADSAPAWDCSSRKILDLLDGPPVGQTFEAGVTVPNWVLQVSEPLAPDAIDESSVADASTRKDANRVVITINGGGEVDGAGGGVNQVSITAGGTTRTEIEPGSTFNAPTFTKARSRCGGPITLVIDDSGSIGDTNMNTVESGVKGFIDAFDGTPTEIQIVRFDSSASVIGASAADWTKYYDMTDPTEVAALKTAASFDAGGGTNWEDALFRAFYNQDGTIQQRLPGMVVFFTDGEPTRNRTEGSYYRGDGGALPADPAPLSAAWSEGTSGSYDQEAFFRSDYIADVFRTSTRFIGVGVGGILSKSVEWVVSPGAGYAYQWERGSHQYQKGEFRYQRRRHGSSRWRTISESTYDQQQTWRYDYRIRLRNWRWISESEYAAGNVNSSESDGYRQRSKSFSSPYLDWEPVSSGGSGDGYRSTTTNPVTGPYDGFDDAVTESTAATTVLTRLISANDNGVRAILENGSYINAAEADMYLVPNFATLNQAFQAVALAECGGTVTLQTKIGGNAAPDPFTYQNTAITESDGSERVFDPTIVTTNSAFVTGTFDFSIPDGSFVTVDIVPQFLSELANYNQDSWSCRAGATTLTPTPITTPSGWDGVRLQVDPNTAINCTMNVSL